MAETLFVALKGLQRIFGTTVTPELVRVSEPGSSGSRVYIFRHPQTDRSYAVKCVNSSRVSLADEVARHQLLQQYLPHHVPEILLLQHVDGYDVLVSEALGVTLHTAIMQHVLPQSVLLTLWQNMLHTFSTLWRASQHPYEPTLSPRYYPARYARIKAGVESILTEDGKALQDCWTLPMMINGREYPSLNEIFQRNSMPTCPSFGVFCHGDPQPSNILVARNLRWFTVDWEWTGRHHDWRAMLSHLFGWWPLRFQILLDQPRMYVAQHRVWIDYQVQIPPYVKPFQQLAQDLFWQLSGRERYDCDAQDLNVYLSMLYFGEVRFTSLFGRDAYKIPLVAEAVIAASPGDALHEETYFTFQQKDLSLCVH